MPGKFDIHFQLLTPADQVSSSRNFGFGFSSAVGVRGPQKLINRWLKCLMTPKGSDPFTPGAGTVFANLIGGNIGNMKDVVDVIVLAVDDCNEQIRAIDRKALPPDDERLQSATLAEIIEAPSGGGFDAYIHIRNAAGTVVTVGLPTINAR